MKTGKSIFTEYKNQEQAILNGTIDASKTLEQMIDEALQEAKAEGEMAGWKNAQKLVETMLGGFKK